MKISLWTLAFAIGLSCASLNASAQWMWKDDNGHVVASDQPPPSSVPTSRILRSGSGRVYPQPAPDAPSGTPSDDASKPKSLAERDLDFQKRQKKAAEDAKKEQDDTAKQQAKTKHCAELQHGIATFQSGQRMADTNAQGERYVLDDSQRQSRIQELQSNYNQDCN